MALKAAFIFIAPGADSDQHRSIINTPQVELTTVGVANYDQAEKVAVQLVQQGVAAIELCGGFGVEGTAQVKKAVQGKAVIGVVRFDIHPGLNNQSGDSLF
ncbi:DUF6506 family protein [Syntrophomonas erecta subsp. sporosyntropha]